MARRKSILSILAGGSKRKSTRKSKPKSFVGILLENQQKTERKNVPGAKRK